MNLTYKQKARKLYLFKKKFSVVYTHIMYDIPLKFLAWRKYIHTIYMKRFNVLKRLMRNRFSNINLSILDLPRIISYYYDIEDLYYPIIRFALFFNNDPNNYYNNLIKKTRGFKFKLLFF